MQELFGKITMKQKGVLIDALNFVLNISGKPDKSQKEYMASQLGNLGIDIENALSRKSLKAKELILSLQALKDTKFRRFILREMILLAAANNKMSDIDIKHIFEIGLHSGVKQEKIGDMLMWAAKGIEWHMEGVRIVEED